ncbi:MAG: hypothetical protein ACKVOM_09665, partial [Ferruginibacter sp.]
DLDILIEIESTTLPSTKRNLVVWTKMDNYKELNFPKDIFVYTTPEIIKFSENRYSFLSSALKNSKIIYGFN